MQLLVYAPQILLVLYQWNCLDESGPNGGNHLSMQRRELSEERYSKWDPTGRMEDAWDSLGGDISQPQSTSASSSRNFERMSHMLGQSEEEQCADRGSVCLAPEKPCCDSNDRCVPLLQSHICVEKQTPLRLKEEEKCAKRGFVCGGTELPCCDSNDRCVFVLNSYICVEKSAHLITKAAKKCAKRGKFCYKTYPCCDSNYKCAYGSVRLGSFDPLRFGACVKK